MTKHRNVYRTILGIIADCGCASAEVDVFDDRGDWLSAVGQPVATEGFEGRDAVGDLGAPSIYETGLGVNLLEGDVLARVEAGDPDGRNLHNTTEVGSQYLRFGNDFIGDGGFYTVQFLLPTVGNAFGFDISDLESNLSLGNPAVGFFLDGVIQADLSLDVDAGQPNTDEPPIFVGFTTDALFDEVRIIIQPFFNGASGVDVVAFDEVAFVPAPGAVTACLVAGLAVARRRR